MTKMSVEIADEYASSLADLTVNSKPLINMLTILAEENIAHAGVIVHVVEKHLEKVRPEWKLPVLYLVDSIIKNVGHDYKQKFAQVIINMFTKTFKVVDEKTRSQMFKLRETWHEVLPAAKLYQLDVKVNLIDPAWPIQAQPPTQSNIHFNPNFLKKPEANVATPVVEVENKEAMLSAVVALKEQELLLLQRKKVEIELEQTRKQLEENKKILQTTTVAVPPVVASVSPIHITSAVPSVVHTSPTLPVKQRLGPPVKSPNSGGTRISPVSGVMAASLKRQDPRLARIRNANKINAPQPPTMTPQMTQLFDAKPIERRKNAITIDVQPPARDPRQRQDPRLSKRKDNEEKKDPRRYEINDESLSEPTEVVGANRDIDLRLLTNPMAPESPAAAPISRKRPSTEAIEKIPNKKREKSAVENVDKSPTKKKDGISTDNEEKSPNKKRIRAANENIDKSPNKKKNKTSSEVDKKLDKVLSKKKIRSSKEFVGKIPKKKEVKSLEPKEKSPIKEKSPVKEKPAKEIVKSPKDKSKAAAVEKESKKEKEKSSKEVAKENGEKEKTDALGKSPTKESKRKNYELFGEEDVDLRTLPVPECAPAPPVISTEEVEEETELSQENPATWSKLKEPSKLNETEISNKSKLDAVRAKLAEATKGKDRLGRPLLFSDETKERRRTTSTSEDTDMRSTVNLDSDKETIKIIMNQAEEQLAAGDMNKDQYNKLVMQVLQLNERQKLNEAKQRESLEKSKRKLQKIARREPLSSDEEVMHSPKENFGDIDERIVPIPNASPGKIMDLDLRVPPLQPPSFPEFNMIPPQTGPLPSGNSLLPLNMRPNMPVPPPPGPMPPNPFIPQNPRMLQPPMPGGFRPMWRHPSGPRQMLGFPPNRMGFEPRGRLPRPPFLDNPPIIGSELLENPFNRYERTETPPPLGGPQSKLIPLTDFRHIDYIRNDTVKTIEIDGIPREIIFYGDKAIIMMGWDDPREIKFLPTTHRITFNAKDSFFLTTNDEYKTVDVDGQDLVVKLGYPTRELYVNHRWYECYFGGNPFRIALDEKLFLVHLEGPPPKVDVGEERRLNFVAGKINMIVDAKTMFPIFLDAKPQIFEIGGAPLVMRFVDSLETVLINEKPFSVEFGGLPKPIYIGKRKHFIRFSALPRDVRPGKILIEGMEGKVPDMQPIKTLETLETPVVTVDEGITNSPSRNLDGENSLGGLDLLASAMPTQTSIMSLHGGYTATIPGLDATSPTKPAEPNLSTVNIDDLYSKLVALGIVKSAKAEVEKKEEPKVDKKEIEDKASVKHVDLLKPASLRQRQPGVVAKLYGGMQCSGCGVRFPPEHTVRYSQHLDWHFRQNRRERDSARRAHSRNWHYDLSDWVQYEEIEDLEEREKSWFENQATDNGPSVVPEEIDPSVPVSGVPQDQTCALCGDRFYQYYDHEREDWHLRGAVRHNDMNYHPTCLQDYKASLNEEIKIDITDDTSNVATETVEEKKESTVDDDSVIMEEGKEKKEDDGWDSDVEVLEPPKEEPQLVQDEEAEQPPQEEQPEEKKEEEKEEVVTEVVTEDDDDDVVLKADPVEEILVDDEDTDDETEERRKVRDSKVPIRPEDIKKEKVDPDDEPVVTAEEKAMSATAHTTQQSATASIDGNVQLPAAVLQIAAPSIRINIAKQVEKAPLQPHAPSTPPPASEEEEHIKECEPSFTYKETMQNVVFVKKPPVKAGTELSGLCSIM